MGALVCPAGLAKFRLKEVIGISPCCTNEAEIYGSPLFVNLIGLYMCFFLNFLIDNRVFFCDFTAIKKWCPLWSGHERMR
jgi:hypothetical protein